MEAAKFWVALLSAVVIAVLQVLPVEWEVARPALTVGAAALGAAAVYLTPNRGSQGRHVAGESHE